MKTFEERYTAWIDGQLTGSALTAFEQELARRAEAGDAEAAETDKAAALQLRGLLKEHLRAPSLGNAEFFSHQMRERIDAEINRAAARREANARPAFRFPTLVWPFARLVGAGVVCLFVAGALYYGTVPSHQPSGATLAVAPPDPQPAPPGLVADNGSPAPAQPAADGSRAGNDKLVLLATPTPTPIDLDEDIRVVTPGAGSNESASTLKVGNANVLWLNNPPYLPDAASASASPTAAPTAAPAASAAPSATP